ncbi:MAG: hypothetical protein ACLSWY_14360, partial [Ruthenibacterium lactatiformans]
FYAWKANFFVCPLKRRPGCSGRLRRMRRMLVRLLAAAQRLSPFGSISPAAKPGWPVVAPAGGNVLAAPFSLCSNVVPRSHPSPSGSLYPPLAALTSGHPFLRLESGWIFPRCLRISDKRKPVRPPYPVIIVRLRKSVFPEFSKRKQAKKQQKSRSGLHRCGLAFSGIFCFTRTWCL